MIRALLFLFLFPSVIFGQGSIIWDTDFNSIQWSVDGSGRNGDPQLWETNGATANLVGNAREGTGAVELPMESDNERNEMNVDALFFDAWNEEFWIGFSFKIVEPLPSSRLFMQIRCKAIDPDSPTVNPIGFRQESPGKWYIQTATDPNYYDVAPVPFGGAGSYTESSNLIDYVQGEWNDVVIYWKPNSVGNSSDGDVKIWVNGEVIVDKSNTTTVYRRSVDGVIIDDFFAPKIGPYAGTLDRVGVYHYDAYKVWKGAGGTYEDVSPLGLSPGDVGGGGTPVAPIQGNKKAVYKAFYDN